MARIILRVVPYLLYFLTRFLTPSLLINEIIEGLHINDDLDVSLINIEPALWILINGKDDLYGGFYFTLIGTIFS